MALLGLTGKDAQGNQMSLPIGSPVPNGITSIPLAANDSYTTGWFLARGYVALYYLMFSNVQGSITFEYSEDNGATQIASPVTVMLDSDFANIAPRVGAFAPRASYIKATFKNGSTAQGVFNLIISLYATNVQPSLETLRDKLADTRLAMVTKTSLQAKDTQGNFDFITQTGTSLNVNVTNPSPTDVSALATSVNQTNGSQKTQIVNGNNQALGTQTNPLRTDPTGSTTQPVSMAAIPTGASTSAKQDALMALTGALTDAAVTNPANPATMIAALKGILTLLGGTLNTTPQTSANSTIQQVSLVANTLKTILAANTSRRGATIQNIGTSIVYVSLGATASATAHTVALQPMQRAYYEVPYNYTGIITAFSVTATTIQVTELIP